MSEPTGDTTENTDETAATNENGAKIPEGYVSLKLAHPLSKDDAVRVRAKVARDYRVDTPIVVPRDEGNRLIEVGLVQVDPTDRVAVRKLLGLNDRDQPLTPEEAEALANAGSPSSAAATDGAGTIDAPRVGDQVTETAKDDQADGEKPRSAKRAGS